MAVMDEMGDVNETLKTLAEQARDAWGRFAEEIELDRRMRETPMAVLGVAAAAGFVLGGGLWPVLRPFAKAVGRAALSPSNLLAVGAAVGAMRAASKREDVPAGPESPATH
jgi:hypothetical protein